MQRRHLLLTGLVGSLAGCSDIIFDDDSSGEGPSEDQELDSPSDGQTSDDLDLAIDQSDLRMMQLTTADLPSAYELIGEELVIVEELDGTTGSELAEMGVIAFHERAFEHNVSSTEQPNIIFSSIGLYESSAAVENGREEIIQLVEDEGGDTEQISIDSSDISLAGEYTTGDGRFHGVVFAAVEEVETYVITSDNERHFTSVGQSLVEAILGRIRE